MALRVGLIGCGNISDIYLSNAKLFRDFDFVACADLNAAAAAKQAAAYGLEQRGVDALLASNDVDVVLNLTIPAAHAAVSHAALTAGKHVYCEKPLATLVSDGVALMALAREKGLRVGCAPDTVLGAAVQDARRRVDAGEIGRPLIGTAAFMGHGMEAWHPTPEFFFKPGAGPVFDMGPYYLSTLVTLFGPVAHVLALAQSGFAERIVTTEGSPVKGQRIKVETPTSIQALLAFLNGAQISLMMSWDVWAHSQLPLELHGTEASMRVPDPNWFGGEISLARPGQPWQNYGVTDLRFGQANWPAANPELANYRGLGLADMARGILDQRPHRVNGDIGLHVLAVMEGILAAAAQGGRAEIAQSCARPAALGDAEARGLLT